MKIKKEYLSYISAFIALCVKDIVFKPDYVTEYFFAYIISVLVFYAIIFFIMYIFLTGKK